MHRPNVSSCLHWWERHGEDAAKKDTKLQLEAGQRDASARGWAEGCIPRSIKYHQLELTIYRDVFWCVCGRDVETGCQVA